MGMNTMIPVLTPLTCGYKECMYPLSVTLEMSRWVSTHEPTQLTIGLNQVGLRKIQCF